MKIISIIFISTFLSFSVLSKGLEDAKEVKSIYITSYEDLKHERKSKDALAMEYHKENRMNSASSRSKYLEKKKALTQVNPSFSEELYYNYWFELRGFTGRVHLNQANSCELVLSDKKRHEELVTCAKEVNKVMEDIVKSLAIVVKGDKKGVEKKYDYLSKINEIKNKYKCGKEHEGVQEYKFIIKKNICEYHFGTSVD